LQSSEKARHVELPGDRAVQMAIESRTGVKSMSGLANN
jgi:hypothetical protein